MSMCSLTNECQEVSALYDQDDGPYYITPPGWPQHGRSSVGIMSQPLFIKSNSLIQFEIFFHNDPPCEAFSLVH